MTDDVLEVWGKVREWPADMRLSLASKILQSLEHPAGRPKTLADLVGIIAGEGPPPSDQEVEQILFEERTRKYS